MKNKWHESKLESVDCCPYCSCDQREIAHEDVEDWSFGVAPGLWTYYKCKYCDSLFLDPRPDKSSIGEAYSHYYTHSDGTNESFINSTRLLIKNDWLSYLLKKNVLPRLNAPKSLIKLLILLSGKKKLPFWISQLNLNSPGRFLDMGSGSGGAILLAKQLGWESIGIDFDPIAVEATRKKGLTVFLGNEELLSSYSNYFDYVLCSHVLEHVHNPREFINSLCNSVKVDGILVITLPNSTSAFRKYFGDDWRGLEAPRHLSIPSQKHLIEMFETLGFKVKIKSDNTAETVLESLRLQRRSLKPKLIDILYSKFVRIKPNVDNHTNDFIKLVCQKI